MPRNELRVQLQTILTFLIISASHNTLLQRRYLRSIVNGLRDDDDESMYTDPSPSDRLIENLSRRMPLSAGLPTPF
jgi:hypothetical protein